MKEKLQNYDDRTELFAKMSYINNGIFGIFKIVLALLSKSFLIFIYAFYNIGMAVAKKTSISDRFKKNKYHNYYLVGLIIIVSSVIYVVYSIYVFFHGSNASYHEYVGIGIAALTFTDITLAIIGVIKAKKQKNIRNEAIKFINLASAFISLSLTQTALLSFTTSENMSKYNAIGGIIFGSVSILIGTYMVFSILFRKNR